MLTYDYVSLKGVTVLNVPYVHNEYNKQDPHLLKGKTVARILHLLHENEQLTEPKKVIEFS